MPFCVSVFRSFVAYLPVGPTVFYLSIIKVKSSKMVFVP